MRTVVSACLRDNYLWSRAPIRNYVFPWRARVCSTWGVLFLFFVFDCHKYSRRSIYDHLRPECIRFLSERDDRDLFLQKKKKQKKRQGSGEPEKVRRNLRPKSSPNCLRAKTGVFFSGATRSQFRSPDYRPSAIFTNAWPGRRDGQTECMYELQIEDISDSVV